jgi:two-component system cell cycle response regulator
MTARVLVVDDIAFNVKLLETKLKQEYYSVLVANNGVEAINVAKAEKPDIILMDIMMPEMDGFESTRLIKSDPETTYIPIIIITALNANEDKVRGLSVGADDFLTKPINDQALMVRLRSLLRMKFMTDELRLRDSTGKQFGLVDFPTISEQSSTDGAKVLVVDDDVAQAKKIKDQLCDIKIGVDVAKNEKEALAQAIENDYSLFIVSTELLDSDGLMLCSQIRNNEKLRHTPILIMIEESNQKVLLKGMEMGVNDYLVMPVDNSEMVARVKTQIRKKRYQDALRNNYLESISFSVTDALTNLYNRRYFDAHIKSMLSKAQTDGKPLSLLIVDIDFFKKVNDTYGHSSGDAVIQEIAKRMMMSVRPTDLCTRYGGEEFVILLPSTLLADACKVAERIRSTVERYLVILPDGSDLSCTISVGVSVSNESDTAQTLLDRADKCLYEAKHQGRNRVIAEQS